MFSSRWKIGLTAVAMTGLVVLPACEEDPMDTEPINTNTVDIEPVEPLESDTDLQIQTQPAPTTPPAPGSTPQTQPGQTQPGQSQPGQTTQPGQTQPGQDQQLEPLPQPGQADEQKQNSAGGQVEPLPQPSTP